MLEAMTKKRTTIDDLAEMVQRGFKETAKQADVDKRFDGVDRRLDAIEGCLERVEKLMLANGAARG